MSMQLPMTLELLSLREPQRASSPALLFGYELLLASSADRVNTLAKEHIVLIEAELEERKLLGPFREMLEADRMHKQRVNALAQVRPLIFPEPEAMFNEQLLCLHKVLVARLATLAKDDPYAAERLRGMLERVVIELHRRDLWLVARHLQDLEVNDQVRRAHAN